MIKVKDLLSVKFEDTYERRISFILKKNDGCHNWIGIYHAFSEIPEEYHEIEVVQMYPGDRLYFNIVIDVK